MQLTNKTVYITGGAGGIGTAFAQALLEKGANVIIADINETKGTELADKFQEEFGKDKAVFIKCDVSKFTDFQDAFKSAVSTFKQIDIMVNNAAVHDEKDLEKLFHVNLKGVMVGTELALSHMRKDRGGQGGVIINVSSDCGHTPVFFVPAYTAAKHGIVGYTRALATVPNLSQQGVRYACLCPALTDTPFADTMPDACRQEYRTEAAKAMSNERNDPETVAEALLTLIDDDDSNNVILAVSTEEGIQRKKITVESI